MHESCYIVHTQEWETTVVVLHALCLGICVPGFASSVSDSVVFCLLSAEILVSYSIILSCKE